MDLLYLAPLSRPGRSPPMKISRGWDPLSLLDPKVRAPRSLAANQAARPNGCTAPRGRAPAETPADRRRARLLFSPWSGRSLARPGDSTPASGRGEPRATPRLAPCRGWSCAGHMGRGSCWLAGWHASAPSLSGPGAAEGDGRGSAGGPR